ncbi:hypothetical protein BKI52_45240 [marine bacterium AO1-C]|nr:hypothetical protein BKI52_45240 [marine bacterium AO1-C]
MSQTPTTYGLPKKRDEVIEALKEAYANENLEEQEFEKRLDEAMKAASNEALQVVLFDFPAEIRNRIFPQNETLPSSTQGQNLPATAQVNKVKVIMGNDNRIMPEFSNAISRVSAFMSNQKLDFRVSKVPETPISLHIENFMSNTDIDLRNELLDGKKVNLHISGALGNIKIFLPRGVTIHRNVQMMGGSFNIQDKQRSWIKRLTGKSNKPVPADIQLEVNILGSFWLGNIKVIY